MILTVEEQRPDAVFFLGDGWRDAEELTYAYPELPLYRVPGNCDWSVVGQPSECQVSLDGVTFLLCHGHTYAVKNGYGSLLYHARQLGADVALCGHTHTPYYETVGAVQLFNPGSIGYGHTYGVLLTQKGSVSCSLRSTQDL
jgi:putative phosphoesterase